MQILLEKVNEFCNVIGLQNPDHHGADRRDYKNRHVVRCIWSAFDVREHFLAGLAFVNDHLAIVVYEMVQLHLRNALRRKPVLQPLLHFNVGDALCQRAVSLLLIDLHLQELLLLLQTPLFDRGHLRLMDGHVVDHGVDHRVRIRWLIAGDRIVRLQFIVVLLVDMESFRHLPSSWIGCRRASLAR